MAKISRIEPKTPILKKRQRVAAYARVSKDTERLMHSVSAQVSYYSSLIQKNPEWEYAGVYADSGISGTGIKERDEFQRLIEDCEAGKIDIVLTKSISRFARNTVDLLATVRRLKELGVEVRFEKENISSFSGDGELMMTIIASFAQEEVRSTSENIKWGIRKGYANGIDVARNKKVFGYRYDGEKYIIQEDEAEIVRFIFKSMADGVAPNVIVKELNARGAKTWRGYDFSYGNLATILRNEIYIGDRRMQKCFVADPIKHNKVKNRGELPQYYISDCHEPIIDKETFDKVQEIMRQRAEAVPTYPFTKKIVCGTCGRQFTRKKGKVKGKTYIHWICRGKKEVGTTCSSVNFSEEELEKISAQMMGMQDFDGDAFEKTVSLITVEKNGNLRFQFTDGSTKVWKNLRLHPQRHEVTVTDCFQGKIVCAHCGNTYHRVVSGDRWVYWYCMGKKKKGVECHSINYADFQLRRVSASVLGLKDFKESAFEQNIEKIMVLEDGSLEYHFYEGRTETWQRM
jgi:site-specific DNA recombinase